MSTKAWAREMALYTRWQEGTLFGLCETLSDAERKRDNGLFFGSIHHTLDHILMVDGRLLRYVVDGQPSGDPFEPRRIVHEDYEALKQARFAFNTDLLALIEDRPDDWLDGTLTMHAAHLGRERTVPRQFYMMQMFNHGTHHRAQVTAALHRMGIGYGNTDLPFNPLSQY